MLLSNYSLIIAFHLLVGSMSDSRSRGLEFEPQPGYITCMEADHEIISTAVLPLLLIQAGQSSVSCKSMCS